MSADLFTWAGVEPAPQNDGRWLTCVEMPCDCGAFYYREDSPPCLFPHNFNTYRYTGKTVLSASRFFRWE